MEGGVAGAGDELPDATCVLPVLAWNTATFCVITENRCVITENQKSDTLFGNLVFVSLDLEYGKNYCEVIMDK